MIISKKYCYNLFVVVFSIAAIFVTVMPLLAANQDYTGVINQVDDEGTGIYVTFPVNIGSDSEVSLWFGAQCENQDNLKFRFNTTTNPYGDDPGHTINGNAYTVQPLGYYPMKAGQYEAMFFCEDQEIDPDNEVLYNLVVETAPISITSYPEDKEPDPDYERILTTTTSFKGWLNLMGYPGAGSVNPMGEDPSDMYMLNMAEGTNLSFKLDFDNFNSSNGGKDLGFRLRLYRWKNEQTYYVTDYDPILQSGQRTKEINLLESGAYKFYVAFYDTLGESPTDNNKYGGYKVTAIINGNEPLDAKIGGIKNISTRYWSDIAEKFVTVDDLVPGAKSNVDIYLSNNGSQTISATLVYGLSIKGGPIKRVGSTKLNVGPSGGASAVYNTSLFTPADTPFALTGDLVVVLYDSANEVLDTYTTKVDIFTPGRMVSLPFLFMLLGNPIDRILE